MTLDNRMVVDELQPENYEAPTPVRKGTTFTLDTDSKSPAAEAHNYFDIQSVCVPEESTAIDTIYEPAN